MAVLLNGELESQTVKVTLVVPPVSGARIVCEAGVEGQAELHGDRLPDQGREAARRLRPSRQPSRDVDAADGERRVVIVSAASMNRLFPIQDTVLP